MDPLDASEGEGLPRGEVRFIDGSTLTQLRGAASAAGMLYAEVAAPGPAARGQLGEFLEAAVEEALARRGAPGPAIAATSDWSASLADQVARTRRVGLRGVVLVVGSLRGALGASGALDPDDSAALRAYSTSARELPIALLLDSESRTLCGYGPPVPIDELLGVRGGHRPAAPAPSPAPAAAPLQSLPASTASGASTGASAADADTDVDVHVEVELEAAPAVEQPPPAPAAIDTSSWKQFAEELHAARGPKPLPVVERMFVTRYVPLAEAELLGQADSFARQVRADWAASFSKSYSEAFKALGVTGKRPSMVFDVPMLAARIARLHGARAVELFLVDGMRYDLGARVHQRLRRALEGKAACAERMLLWSALPSNTATQLDLLTHGVEALSRPMASEEAESGSVARGRNVSTPRRIKIGPRDLMKLDVVEARLREAGPPLRERLDLVADEVTAAVARHAETLPERTLLVVFGDHGFLTEAASTGSGPARFGGSSPEEVLMPGYAWLMGGVH
jgi:hypothetical protein